MCVWWVGGWSRNAMCACVFVCVLCVCLSLYLLTSADVHSSLIFLIVWNIPSCFLSTALRASQLPLCKTHILQYTLAWSLNNFYHGWKINYHYYYYYPSLFSSCHTKKKKNLKYFQVNFIDKHPLWHVYKLSVSKYTFLICSPFYSNLA